MSLFNTLYGATTESVKAAKKPFVEQKIRLGAAGAINNANLAIANLTGKVEKSLSDIVLGDDTQVGASIQRYVNAQAELDTATAGLALLSDLEAKLFAEDTPKAKA